MTMFLKNVLKLVLFASAINFILPMTRDEIVNRVEEWSKNISEALTTLSKTVTRRDEVINKFKDIKVGQVRGDSLLEAIAKQLQDMMERKVEAVKRIKEHAEMLSCIRKPPIEPKSHYDFYDANNFTWTEEGYEKLKEAAENEKQWKCDMSCALLNQSKNTNSDFLYWIKSQEECNCKDVPYIRREPKYFRNLSMGFDPHFDSHVHLNYSAVKVATSVYGRKKNVLNNIRWSEPLDLAFRYNYDRDPTLTWQYFASPSGFMRLYPATNWSQEEYDLTYDFRTRSWYTESMGAPKDIIIILDRSGSMISSRRNITAKHIIHDILDTLSDNDYINIYTFTNTTEPLVECFNDTLVQANEENLRLIRESLDLYVPIFSGNLHLGLNKAFELLDRFHGTRSGIKCNQIIMLVTEGLDYYDYHTNLTKMYDRPDRRIRIFTYLLGTEESDADKMVKIACDNLGYFVNITLESEIREKVVEYLKVLSRPINMRKDKTPQPIWSALYVDLTDRKLTNWLWQKEEGIKQRKIFIEYAHQEIREKGLILDPTKKHFLLQTSHDYEKYLIPKKYTYLTTVSLPVFNRNMTTLLGVAAVDVPLDYMKTLMMPHELGVNGYAFIITNNGYVLMHPDHRTNFQTILKPTFNRVDLTEVELSSKTREARAFDEDIIQLREEIVNQTKGSKTLSVMTHMDDMRRIFLGRRKYYYTGIDPYSLVIALPDQYGLNKLKYKRTDCNVTTLKMANNWKIHPEWSYNIKLQENRSREDILLEIDPRKCRWEGLLNSLFQDVSRTNWFVVDNINSINVKNQCLLKSVTTAFLATHSGLTRWKNFFTSNEEEKTLNADKNHFSNIYNKSIDEVWYKRAVEENFIERDAFIFSIPFHSSGINTDDTLVTVTNAVFRETNEKVSPVAVIGYQFYYKGLLSIFDKIECGEIKPDRNLNISGNTTCLILDNHGYIVLSKDLSQVGKLIVNVDKNITHQLEEDKIFTPITVFDYQGICFPNKTSTTCPSSGGSSCRVPIDKRTKEFEKRAIQKTIPTPCDKELRMYNLTQKNYKRFNKTGTNCLCPYVVRHISGTNLIFLTILGECCIEHLNENLRQDFPKEKVYDVLLPCYIATKNNYTKRPYINCSGINDQEYSLNVNKNYCGGQVKHMRDEL